MKTTIYARLSGWALFLMAVLAGFAVGYAYPLFHNNGLGTVDTVALLERPTLYTAMLASLIAVLLLDLVVAIGAFMCMQTIHRPWARWAMLSRIGYSAIFAVAIGHLFPNLGISPETASAALPHFLDFQRWWSIALVVFGAHLLLLGLLVKRSHRWPWLSYLLFFAGCAYSALHLLSLGGLAPSTLETLNMVLGLPMALAELLLAVWFLVHAKSLAAAA